jgi:iron complex transport system ATP-binding protein
MAERLSVSDLTVGYRRRLVIDRLSLPPIGGGEVTALIGPNGAGKSTLLRALAGLQPARGSVRLGGKELLGLAPERHAAHVSYMPQSVPARVALRVLEAVISSLMASPLPDLGRDSAAVRRRAMETLDRVGIGDLALEALDELSGGQRQLVSLAMSLARNPQVLLLDEPTSALDLHHQFRVMTLLSDLARERETVTVVVLHDLNLAAAHADRVMVLAGGRLAGHGTPLEALTADILSDVYRVRARIEDSASGRPQIVVEGVTGVTAA